MTEPTPEYFVTSATHPNVELVSATITAELIRARRAIIQAGQAIEALMNLPLEQRAIVTRTNRSHLTEEPE